MASVQITVGPREVLETDEENMALLTWLRSCPVDCHVEFTATPKTISHEEAESLVHEISRNTGIELNAHNIKFWPNPPTIEFKIMFPEGTPGELKAYFLNERLQWATGYFPECPVVAFNDHGDVTDCRYGADLRICDNWLKDSRFDRYAVLASLKETR